MILSSNGHFPASFMGMLAYAAAGISSGIAWFLRRKQSSDVRTMACITILEAFLFLDIVFNWRWTLHTAMVHFAIGHARYGQRRVVQTAALAFLGVLCVYVLWATVHKLHGKTGMIVAVWGVLLSLACWCVEIISLHQIDAILYRRVDGWIVIIPVWFTFCLMTAVGVQLPVVNATGL
jgi:hypothetical protein